MAEISEKESGTGGKKADCTTCRWSPTQFEDAFQGDELRDKCRNGQPIRFVMLKNRKSITILEMPENCLAHGKRVAKAG
jgi:hypothetical protein